MTTLNFYNDCTEEREKKMDELRNKIMALASESGLSASVLGALFNSLAHQYALTAFGGYGSIEIGPSNHELRRI